MDRKVDCFWSFRSPYSYLAMQRMCAWEKDYAVRFRMRVVYPLAIRDGGFFARQHPQWLPYLLRDCQREAERWGIKLAPPDPDPIVMDMATRQVAQEQPYIERLTLLGAVAADQGQGLAFCSEVSRLIWSGDVKGWHTGTHLAEATEKAGLDLKHLENTIEHERSRYEQLVQSNQVAQTRAGHWGVPLFVYGGEPFFGQDRMDALMWRLQQSGMTHRLEEGNQKCHVPY